MRNCTIYSSLLNPRQRELMPAFLIQFRRQARETHREARETGFAPFRGCRYAARIGSRAEGHCGSGSTGAPRPRSARSPRNEVGAAFRITAESVREVRANSFTPKKATLSHKSISLDTVRPSGANQLRASRPIWGARLRHEMSDGVALEVAVALPDCRGFGASAAI
jgi:hypothetical protein